MYQFTDPYNYHIYTRHVFTLTKTMDAEIEKENEIEGTYRWEIV